MRRESTAWLSVITVLVGLSCQVTEPGIVEFDPIYQFVDVQFADEQTGILVANTSVYFTGNGGRTWRYSRGAPTYLHGGGFADTQTALVVGNNTTVLRTADGGLTWSNPFDDMDLGYTPGFKGVSFVDARRGWIVGGSDVYKTIDGGATWTRQWITSSHIYAGCFTDSLNGTVVTNNSIVRTVDGGKTWIKQKEKIPEILLGVDFLNRDTGIAVGTEGLILRTDDGGTNWTTQRKSPDGVGQLWDVQFIDVNTCVVVGSGGLILKTTDAGATWTEHESHTDQRLHAVAFVSAEVGMIVGGNSAILRTSNGGATWSLVRFWTSLEKPDHPSLSSFHPLDTGITRP